MSSYQECHRAAHGSCHVYVLRLEGGRFYIGSTASLAKRIVAHYGGEGSKWTKLYPPVLPVEATIPCDEREMAALETATCVAYMQRHGFEKVRGAAWCGITCPAPSFLRKAQPKSRAKQRNLSDWEEQPTD